METFQGLFQAGVPAYWKWAEYVLTVIKKFTRSVELWGIRNPPLKACIYKRGLLCANQTIPGPYTPNNPSPTPRTPTPTPGGGVLGLEKRTDCGPTSAEQWLSRPKMAKKRGLFSYHVV